MADRKMKKVVDSQVEQTYLVMPSCMNGAGFLFGGQLLSWLDETAAIVGRRHAETDVVTVAIDNMYFRAGAKIDDMIVLVGRVTYVGTSSMEIRIDTYVEKREGTRKLINTAYFVMVGVDKNQNPQKIPGLIIDGITQQIEWEQAKKRVQLRKERKNEGY